MMWCKRCQEYFESNLHLCPGEKLRQKDALLDSFVAQCRARLHVGQYRYGSPDRSAQYHRRLLLEVKAYNKTGNAEHLYNIANYCLLESIAPGHPKHHINPLVESVTRGKL
jgi:hypothetical protein